MFTLKLFRGLGVTAVPSSGEMLIVEGVAIKAIGLPDGGRQITVFTTKAGVDDTLGCNIFKIGGESPMDRTSVEEDHFDWAVVENSNGKTTQTFR